MIPANRINRVSNSNHNRHCIVINRQLGLMFHFISTLHAQKYIYDGRPSATFSLHDDYSSITNNTLLLLVKMMGGMLIIRAQIVMH